MAINTETNWNVIKENRTVGKKKLRMEKTEKILIKKEQKDEEKKMESVNKHTRWRS